MTLIFDMSVLDEIESDIIERGNQTLAEMINYTEQIIPVGRTGELKAGLRIFKRFEPGSLYGEIGIAGVYYAPFVHFGTSRQRAQPFLHQAFDAIAPRFLQGLGSAVELRLSAARNYQTQAAPRQFGGELFRRGGSFTYLFPGQVAPSGPETEGINFLSVTPRRSVGPFGLSE